MSDADQEEQKLRSAEYIAELAVSKYAHKHPDVERTSWLHKSPPWISLGFSLLLAAYMFGVMTGDMERMRNDIQRNEIRYDRTAELAQRVDARLARIETTLNFVVEEPRRGQANARIDQ